MRTLPNSPESERGVVGAMLLAPDCIPVAVDILGHDGSRFHDVRMAALYSAIVAAQDAGKPTNAMSLIESLRTSGGLDACGGSELVLDCLDSAPSASLVEHFANIVADRHTLRQMIEVCRSSADRMESAESAEQIIDDVEQSVLGVRSNMRTSSAVTIRQLVRDAIGELEDEHNRQSFVSGMPSGFNDLDRLTGGFRPGEVVVLAALPGTGKTALAMQFAEHAAVDRNVPCGVFSLEMSGQQLTRRMICSRARTNGRESWRWSERDFACINTAAIDLSRSKLSIIENTTLSTATMRAKARRMVKEMGVQMFVIDYIQLLTAATKGGRSDSRQEEVAEISRQIKAMAREHNVPVIALSQLNDQGMLRESRAIGQDADQIIFLDRDEKQPEQNAGIINITLRLAKNRNGATGNVPLVFVARHTRFEQATQQ